MNIAQKLHELLKESELQGESVLLPDWGGVSIYPRVFDATDRTIGIEFYVSCPLWDRELFERVVGFGASQEDAIGSALGNFVFGMLGGVKQMMKDQGYKCGGCTCEVLKEDITTAFADNQHKWSVYKSDVLGMGIKPSDSQDGNILANIYDGVNQEITKRLGNQKLCYVKLFITKNSDDPNSLVCECRINDFASEEIAALMREYCQNWKVDGFALQKMFVMYLQSEDTYTPFPHSQEAITNYVQQAIGLIAKLKPGDNYFEVADPLGTAIGDKNIAQEIISFLPEMCAEAAFQEMSPPESIGIAIGDKDAKWFYKTQVTSYYPIQQALQVEFNKSMTEKMFGALVGISSIYNVLCSMGDSGKDINDLKDVEVACLFHMNDDYTLR